MSVDAIAKFLFGLFLLGGLAYLSNKIADGMRAAMIEPAEQQASQATS